MRHRASPEFRAHQRKLPVEVQRSAVKSFDLLKTNPHHPSLRLKEADQFWSARVGLHHGALAVEIPDGLLWFWIGTHADYDAFSDEAL